MAAGGGGSWKVAYADFVTAMMALFLVLWITNQSEKVKGAVESYFKNPWKSPLKDSTGIIPVKNADVVQSSKSHNESPSVVQLNFVKRINDEDLVKTFVESPEFRENKSLNIEVTDEGLLINFLDNPSQPTFNRDSADFTDYGKWVFSTVAWNIARYPSNAIELNGHTERNYKPSAKDGPGAWEISTRRALACQKLLVENGVGESQIKKVSGLGGTTPMKKVGSPDDPTNRRVTILLRSGVDQP